jgi:hypothetical protein
MIEKIDRYEYVLLCDNCGDDVEEMFESFQDAVEYKKDKDNGWCTVKDKNGDWCELCPACNTPGIIAKLKGMSVPGKSRDELEAINKTLKALEEDV